MPLEIRGILLEHPYRTRVSGWLSLGTLVTWVLILVMTLLLVVIKVLAPFGLLKILLSSPSYLLQCLSGLVLAEVFMAVKLTEGTLSVPRTLVREEPFVPHRTILGPSPTTLLTPRLSRVQIALSDLTSLGVTPPSMALETIDPKEL